MEAPHYSSASQKKEDQRKCDKGTISSRVGVMRPYTDCGWCSLWINVHKEDYLVYKGEMSKHLGNAFLHPGCFLELQRQVRLGFPS